MAPADAEQAQNQQRQIVMEAPRSQHMELKPQIVRCDGPIGDSRLMVIQRAEDEKTGKADGNRKTEGDATHLRGGG